MTTIKVDSAEDIERREYMAMLSATSTEKLAFLRKKELEQTERLVSRERAEKIQKFQCLKLADALVNRLECAARDDLNWWLVYETARRILVTQTVQEGDYTFLATMSVTLPEAQDRIEELSDLDWNEWYANNK